MVKKVKSGDEYKVMHQKSTAKKIANIFSFLWIICVTLPVCYVIYTRADAIKEFVVVKGVYEANKALMDQYTTLSNDLVNKININKYTSKIKVPEIKLDTVVEKTEKVNKAANILSKVGVKEATKVADTTSALQAQVDKINNQIKTSTENITKTLQSDLTSALKTELSEFGSNQMQKQLSLNDTNYKNLVADRYGIMTENQRKITSSIYKEFSNSKVSGVRNVMTAINKYFKWFALGVLVIVFIITLIPVIIAKKIAKIFTKNLNKCPYCGKVYFSKQGKLGLLGFLKFWK
ncbi:hypothetical protein HDR60_02365 [bacterium]|nr:hypothetical protein [bacterium]